MPDSPDIFDQVAPSSQQGAGDIFDQTEPGPHAPVNPYADRDDLSNVPGATPGMQTPQQVATQQLRQNIGGQPVEHLDIFDALTGNTDAPDSANAVAQRRDQFEGAMQKNGIDPNDTLGSALYKDYEGSMEHPIESAARAVPVAGDIGAGAYHAARGITGLAEQQADLLPGVKGPKRSVDEALAPATEAVGGAMDLTMPAFGTAGMVAPVKTALAYFTAIASGQAAQTVAQKLGMTPGEQNFANVVGTFIPIAFHAATQLQAGVGDVTARVPDADGNVRDVNVKTAAVGGRGFGVGVGKGEDGSYYAAGRVGPFSARAKWGGTPEGAPSAPAEPAQLPAPPPDPVQTLQSEKISEVTSAAARAADTETKAEEISKGVPPPSIPAPAGMDDGHLTPQTVQQIGTVIRALPDEVRPKGLLETTKNLAKWLFDKKTIVGPDNMVSTVDSPQAAQKAAVKIVNDEIDRQNQAASDAAQAKQEQLAKQQEDAETARTEREESLNPTKGEGEKTKVEIPDTPLVRRARQILASAGDDMPKAKMDQLLRDNILLPTPVRTQLVDEEFEKRQQRIETAAQENMNGEPTPEGQKPEEIERWIDGVKKGEEPFAHIQEGTTYRPKDTEGLSRTKVKGAKDANGIYYHDPEVSSADIREAARTGNFDQLREAWKQGKQGAGTAEGGNAQEEKPTQVETKEPAPEPVAPPTEFEGSEGKKTNIHLADGSSIPARHRIVELSSLTPSHNGVTFAKNPHFPGRAQERSYDSSKDEQMKVIQHEQEFNPDFLVNTNPDATNGPPIVTSKPVTIDGKKYPAGTVLGGTSRVMTLQRVYTNGAAQPYLQAIQENHRSFGFTPEAPDEFNQPVHVREVEPPQTLEEMHRLMSLLNKPPTQSLDAFDQAVSIGKQLSPDTLSGISDLIRAASDGDSTATLNSVLSNQKSGRQVVKMLEADGIITDVNRGQFVDPSTALLTTTARTQLGNALLANLLDSRDLMQSTPAILKQKLLGSIGSISAITAQDDGWNLGPAMREAAKQYGSLARTTGMDPSEALKQGGMFGEERGPVVDALIRKYDQNIGEVRKSLSAFTVGMQEGRNPAGFLGLGTTTPDPYLDFNFAFGTELTKEQFDAEMNQLRGKFGEPVKGIEQTAPATAEPQRKELWQMRRSEAPNDRDSNGYSIWAKSVVDALKAGKPVPVGVIGDFEDFTGTTIDAGEYARPEQPTQAAQPEVKPAISAEEPKAATGPKPFVKGEKIKYKTNKGKIRDAEIEWTDGKKARIKDGKYSFNKPIEDLQHLDEPQTEEPQTETAVTPTEESKPGIAADETLVDRLQLHFDRGNGPKDYNALKKIVTEFDGKEPDQLRMKQAQEAYEAMLGRVASDIINRQEAGSPRRAFERLVNLYEGQPNLSIRTSTSITNQAYSTPMPLAFVADKFAGIDFKTGSVYEPTAGNGNLLIAANPDNTLANEIEPNRIQNLKDEGFGVVSNDASKWTPSRQFDAVVANPPFGSMEGPVEFDGYTINKLDHLIALKALSVMKDDGRASIIIGATKEPGEIAAKDKPFFNYLYSHYNVAADFELSGDLYSRQGASWPVRVIAVDGRARSIKVVPPASAIERLSTWESVYEQASQHLGPHLEGQRRADVEPDGAVRGEGTGPGGVSVLSGNGGGGPHSLQPEEGEAGDRGSERSGQPGPIVHTVGVPTFGVGDADNVVASDGDVAASDRLAEDQPREKAVRRGTPKSDGSASNAALATEEGGNQFQDVYSPFSEKKDANVLAPKAMAGAMQRAMETVASRVGDIDQFVADELGYADVETMQEAFMGLQVDTIAAAIHAIGNGKGIIIADQTGIGKGRQAAAIIRWAELHGHLPIFVTAKPTLFTDMYGDLHDIGSANAINPLLMNSDATITDPVTGAKIFGNSGGMTPVFQRILETGKLPEGRNALFTTYSQLNTANRQQLVLSRLAGKAVFILDEAHKAGGESNTGLYFRGLLDRAKGAVYLSATYAKRPDNLPLYAGKTDIGIAITDKDKIVSAIQAGGAPLQAVVSNQLAQAGQLFRRERSFDGITFRTHVAEQRKAEHEKISDDVTEVLRAIVHADNLYHEIDFADIKDEMEQDGMTAMAGGNNASQTVNHMEFTSIVHNLTKQLLLGLKADDVADMIIQDIKDGKKPIIALENTMGSFLNHYAASNALTEGAPLHNFGYSTVLKRALDRTRYYNLTDQEGKKHRVEVPVEKLSEATKEAYRKAEALISKLKVNIPVSPIDWIRNRVEQAGHMIAEITGRDLRVDYSREVPTLSRIPSQEKKDRVATGKGFNNGGIDALIMNQAGSTGISLHASEKFKDQRTRIMYVVQPAGDVNEFMQMLGRINRTGQVRLPEFVMFAVALPAETRPAMNLSKKMKSLNANTTSNTRSAVSVESPDMMNKYGDKVVQQYLAENPTMAAALGMHAGDSSDDDKDAGEDVARKATGRSALLPVKEQKEFMEAVTDQYSDLIKYLDDTGQNDLEPKTYDFAAREKAKTLIYRGTDPNSPFGQDAHFGLYSIKRQGKPYTPDEVKDQIREGLAGAKDDIDRHRQIIEELDKQYKPFLDRQTAASSMDRAAQTRQGTMNFMGSYRIGAGVRLEINGEAYNAVVTNVEGAKKPAGNPFAASSMKYTLAVNGPMRSIKVSGSELAKIAVMPLGARINVDKLFQDINPDARMSAGIITGNLLGAYGALKNVKGRIISFTMEDGAKQLGILMPAKFDPKENVTNEYALRTADGALEVAKTFPGSAPPLMGSDGDVMVQWQNNGLLIKTKLGKAAGGKFFLDADLRGLVHGGEFVSRGGLMQATVKSGQEKEALQIIMQKAALYATTSMIERARESDDRTVRGAAPAQPTISAPKPQQSVQQQPATQQKPATPAVQVDDKEREMLKAIRAGNQWSNTEDLLHHMGETDAEFRQFTAMQIARLVRKGLLERRDQNGDTDFRRTPEGTAALNGRPSLMSEEGSATIPEPIAKAGEAAGQYAAKAIPATWNEITKFAGASRKSAAKIGYEVAAAFAPATLADNDALDVMGHATGEPALRIFQAAQLMRGIDKMFKGMTPEKQVEFVDRWQTGRKQLSTDLQNAQELMQSIMEQQREREIEAINLGRDEDDQIELTQKANYFPNRYKKGPSNELIPTEEENIARLFSRRPLEGSKAFLKKQTYTLKEAVAKGAEPLGTPVDMLMRRLHEGAKFVAAKYAWHNFKEMGIASFLKQGKQLRPDYERVNDKSAKVFRRIIEEDSGRQGFMQTGEWTIQKDAARLLNNYLSTDHIRGSEIGAQLVNLKNMTTEFRLAISPFHYGYITVETFASGLNQGLDKFYNQGVRNLSPAKMTEGLEEIGKSITAPYAAVRVGGQMLKYSRNPEEFLDTPEGQRFAKDYPDFPRLMALLFHGGLRWGMADTFKQSWGDGFLEAMKAGELGKGVLKAVPWAAHGLMKPLFEHYIPRAKWVFAVNMLASKLAQYSQALAAGTMTEETIAREVAATTDNRFGEFNWDSLYLNNTLRTGMQLAFRSATWKIGSWRGLVQAGREQFTSKMFDDRIFDRINEEADKWDWLRDKTRKLPQLGMNAGWILSMGITVAVLGSFIEKMASGKWPWEWAAESKNGLPTWATAALEAMHPRTGANDQHGQPLRLSFPTGLKDYEHGVEQPGRYVKGSLSDVLSNTWDTLQNRDAFGNYVYNPTDPAIKEFMQGVAYNFRGDFLPMSASNYSREWGPETQGTRLERATGMLGGAPKRLDESAALAKALSEKTHEPHTPEQEEAYSLAQHQPPTRSQVLRAAREKNLTYLDRVVLHDLTYAEAKEIYEKYASPEERKTLEPIMQRKRTIEIMKARRGGQLVGAR